METKLYFLKMMRRFDFVFSKELRLLKWMNLGVGITFYWRNFIAKKRKISSPLNFNLKNLLSLLTQERCHIAK